MECFAAVAVVGSPPGRVGLAALLFLFSSCSQYVPLPTPYGCSPSPITEGRARVPQRSVAKKTTVTVRYTSPGKNNCKKTTLAFIVHVTEPVLKIRAVGLTVANGKRLCDYTNQGMAARQRALDRGYRGSRPPKPRDQSLHSTNKRRYF